MQPLNRSASPHPEPNALVARKVAFSATTVGVLSLVAAGFVSVSANRLMPGETLSLWTAVGATWTGLLLGGGMLLAAACLRPFPDRARGPLLGGLSCVILLTLLLLAGKVAAQTAAATGPIARVSLGPVFWGWLFLTPMIFADTFTRAQKPTRLLLAVIGAGSAALVLVGFAAGWLDQLSVVREYMSRQDRFFGELRTHLFLSGVSVGMACLIGVPLGYWAHVSKRLETPAFFVLNTLQTLPSLALFSLLIPTLAALAGWFPILADLGVRGIGTAPALIALTLYSILPVTRNTHTGFGAVDQAMREAGRGMGMTPAQLLWQVELPIASPIILNGLRIALVQVLGLTAVAALIGAGGFGVFIFQGLGQAANDLILLGAIPTVLIAVAADAAMQGLIAMVRPRGFG